jgi:hypothetical protein
MATMCEKPPTVVQNVGASEAAWWHREWQRVPEQEETSGLEQAMQRLRSAAQQGSATAAAVLKPLRIAAEASARLREATAKMTAVQQADPVAAPPAANPPRASVPVPVPVPAANSVPGNAAASAPLLAAPAQRATQDGKEQLKALFRQQAAAAVAAATASATG